jgi:hypothetical protein
VVSLGNTPKGILLAAANVFYDATSVREQSLVPMVSMERLPDLAWELEREG